MKFRYYIESILEILVSDKVLFKKYNYEHIKRCVHLIYIRTVVHGEILHRYFWPLIAFEPRDYRFSTAST